MTERLHKSYTSILKDRDAMDHLRAIRSEGYSINDILAGAVSVFRERDRELIIDGFLDYKLPRANHPFFSRILDAIKKMFADRGLDMQNQEVDRSFWFNRRYIRVQDDVQKIFDDLILDLTGKHRYDKRPFTPEQIELIDENFDDITERVTRELFVSHHDDLVLRKSIVADAERRNLDLENPFRFRVEAVVDRMLAEHNISTGQEAAAQRWPQIRGVHVTWHPRRVVYEEIRQVAGRRQGDETVFTEEQEEAVERRFDEVVAKATARLFPAATPVRGASL